MQKLCRSQVLAASSAESGVSDAASGDTHTRIVGATAKVTAERALKECNTS